MSVEELVRRLRDAAKFTLGESYYGQAADKLEELAAENEMLKRERDKDIRLTNDWEERFWRRDAQADRLMQERDKAEAALAEAKRENEALRELVDSAESIFINCSVTDGVCCCGDDMETHAGPMSCGHTPVDHGAYLVAIWLESRNAGGKNAE